jgi:MFS family permease
MVRGTTDGLASGQRRAPLVALLTANAISQLGTMLTGVAIPWYVLLTTGSAARTGLSGFVSLLPLLIAGVAGGALVDRLGARRVSVGADLLAGIAICTIPLLAHTTGLGFWPLLALIFTANLFDTPGGTARQSLLPDLAALGGLPLERVNAASAAIARAGILLGPPLSGLLIAALGPGNVLWLDAASFLISATIVRLAVPAFSRAPRTQTSYLADLAEGVRFLRRVPIVLGLSLILAQTNILLNPLFLVILPVWVRATSGNPSLLGLLIGAFGAGTLAGTLLFGAVGARLPRRPVLLSGLALAGLPLWPLATLPGPLLTLALLAVMGLGVGPLGPLTMTVLAERTPEALRGRVFGAFFTTVNMAIPLGVLLTGLLIQRAGTHDAILVLAAAYLLPILAAVTMPVFHGLASTPKSGVEPASLEFGVSDSTAMHGRCG